MKIILSLGKSPIKCYPNYADIFSIIDCYSSDYLNWVYNYFIQLTVPNNHELGHRVDFSTPRLLESLPWLNAERLGRKLTMRLCNQNYVDFITNSIRCNKYIFTLLDTFYLNCYDTYGKEHFLHESLIYGFDEELKIFYIADNIKTGKYEYRTIEFDSVEKANQSILDNNLLDWYDGTYLLSYRTNYDYGMCVFREQYTHKYNFGLLYNLIEDFLYERATEDRWTLPNSLVGEYVETSDKCWGLGVYKYLDEYLNMWEAREKFEIRGFYVLYEHKTILREILRFLNSTKECSISNIVEMKCEQSVNTANTIVNLILKFILTKDLKIVNKIKEYMQLLRENDIFILEEMKISISKYI